ncbi:FAD-binding oxidoreductase [Verminephrobacter aporrectodeae subsp. tuberculatae]|uniref:FAD-binding oxidoreductase n=1 Tax=Verminephrobacter aporrectodeae subsp. tuberculatae TaxID=1110392 RepID=A0ABT3KY23_9BURK|nr:FAD-binding oxidoreductase [Verminephrobacter aporrectodeae]MCW5221071.1 FAD-binding oxidoreductase [Verminephrobacter aporrectodeae subsp. tuberculatae]MCW5254826.1 FAD-binding oxidoreductase [Verminephrobacter aporrectodeae subsp. tuberculatae]MCW5290364.1 FAD-binding oxidoreductase [Verminephrobacter aporrectodeae subsp. tuberculatae]MCW5323156.1 FAD-binding oxidoreductase [Verminephrobacter aporrectodeae subsp. tuberculatae]MCW8198810.1 FAD-binding oxidoreductase [Verminephrobacter apor
MNRHVVVIGAGAVGAISAIEALRAGLRVTLLDPGLPGGEQAASYGNAGWLSSHSVIPPAEPGVWRRLPRLIMDPLGPLAIRWNYLPQATPWLLRYIAAGWTAARIAATARALRSLLVDAPALHEGLARQAGVPQLIERRGLLHVYPSRADFEADALAWTIRRDNGVRWLELDAAALHRQERALHPRYQFGVLVPEAGHCRNPGAYVAALVAYARTLGAQWVSARATGFHIERGRLQAVRCDDTEVACDAAVVAAGAHSKALAARAQDRVPLESERGYHVVVESPEVMPQLPLMVSDCKLIATPMETGLRVAGQVEIAGLGAAPDWRRADILRDHLPSIFPALPREFPRDRLHNWLGHRPSTPDGRPCIGFARASSDIVYAFGHGHVGLVGSARTARVVAQLLSGCAPEIPLAPFDPRRFA